MTACPVIIAGRTAATSKNANILVNFLIRLVRSKPKNLTELIVMKWANLYRILLPEILSSFVSTFDNKISEN